MSTKTITLIRQVVIIKMEESVALAGVDLKETIIEGIMLNSTLALTKPTKPPNVILL